MRGIKKNVIFYNCMFLILTGFVLVLSLLLGFGPYPIAQNLLLTLCSIIIPGSAQGQGFNPVSCTQDKHLIRYAISQAQVSFFSFLFVCLNSTIGCAQRLNWGVLIVVLRCHASNPGAPYTKHTLRLLSVL